MSSSNSDNSDNICWICYENDINTVQTCSCNKKVHLHCLARWQMKSYGTYEEYMCRLCKSYLPSWKKTVCSYDIINYNKNNELNYKKFYYKITYNKQILYLQACKYWDVLKIQIFDNFNINITMNPEIVFYTLDPFDNSLIKYNGEHYYKVVYFCSKIAFYKNKTIKEINNLLENNTIYIETCIDLNDNITCNDSINSDEINLPIINNHNISINRRNKCRENCCLLS